MHEDKRRKTEKKKEGKKIRKQENICFKKCASFFPYIY